MSLKVRNKWIKRVVIACVSAVLIIGGIIVGFAVHETNKLDAIADQHYHQRENKFKTSPNIIDGMVLMHISWERKEYKKTIDYAEYCRKSGIDKNKQAWLVHILMASAHQNIGNQEAACSHADLAVKLAKRDHVHDEYLKEYGLKEILGSCSGRIAKP